MTAIRRAMVAGFCHAGPMTTTAAPAPARTLLPRFGGRPDPRLMRVLPADSTGRVDVAAFSSHI